MASPAPARSAAVAGFRHVTPAFRLAGGDAALSTLDRDLDRLAVRRVVVVTSSSMVREAQGLSRVEATVGSRMAGRFADVRPHSPLDAVNSAVGALRESEADGVVVVGGGSAVVTARAAVILHGEDKDVRELCTRRDDAGRLVSPRLRAPKIPVWVVPSTPTTAYAKAGAAVRDEETGERLALFDPAARAQGVFIDPGVAATAPADLMRSASLNALAMTVESLLANDRNPLADAPLIHAATLITECLPRMLADDDVDARVRLMAAALLCGQGTDAVGGGLAQALAHAVGPRSAVANGVVEAILLPHAVRFSDVSSDERLRRLVAAVGSHGSGSQSATTIATQVESLLTSWEVPLRLRDVGVGHDVLDDAASHAMQDWAITQVPRPVQHADVARILQQAW